MPSGTPKQREWVRVPQIKGRLMCSVCGKRRTTSARVTARRRWAAACGAIRYARTGYKMIERPIIEPTRRPRWRKSCEGGLEALL